MLSNIDLRINLLLVLKADYHFFCLTFSFVSMESLSSENVGILHVLTVGLIG